MPHTESWDAEGHFIIAQMSGRVTKDDLDAARASTTHMSQDHGPCGLLIDMRLGIPAADQFDLFASIRAKAADGTRRVTREALVMKDNATHSPQFWEHVSNSSGVTARWFTDLDPAREWLSRSGA